MSIDAFFFIIFNMTFNKTTFIFGETWRVCKGDPYNIIYTHIKVVNSGLPNYQGCKIPVKTRINVIYRLKD
jgi:hypothetical protein